MIRGVRRIFPYLALLLGVALGASAYMAAQPTLAFVKMAQPVEAKVIGIHSCKDRPPPGPPSRLDGIAECADVQYRSFTGGMATGTVRGWPGRATKGETIDILYVPERPELLGRDGALDLWWIPGLLGLAAALVLVRGTVGLGRG